MSQAETESRNIAFDGRIRLNGDAAPELEVIVELTEDFIVLDHPSGQLGRWDRSTVQVSPIGRGWFSINVEEETVTFLPRRPGHFAASTLDLVPVEAVKKHWWQRSTTKQEKADETPALSRKERKRLAREEAARATFAPSDAAASSRTPGDRTCTVGHPGCGPDRPGPDPGRATGRPGYARAGSGPRDAYPERPGPTPGRAGFPWDDVPVPEIPGRKPKDNKRPRSVPEAAPRPDPEPKTKPSREKAPKPPKPARTKEPRGKAVELAGTTRPVKQTGPRKKNALSRAFAGFWHGLKGIALRVSDELRQTGIVPFDRLPAAPARSRPEREPPARLRGTPSPRWADPQRVSRLRVGLDRWVR